ncbi:uncharacterized protein LOC129774270 [Toxorhynchites rutilus septentrionalis]|uniref:uncharacterized protein LOC129774270 n=1 Tax=Toxorhynchites rutilus septentrionalis TaxID=329112 RepID=UPI0024793B83|nr:uncharacterized protein LOC129774270 [Toxorhynchites rutilus septentrionalis]
MAAASHTYPGVPYPMSLNSQLRCILTSVSQDRQFRPLPQASQQFRVSKMTCSNCYLWLPAIVLLFEFTSSVPANFPPVSPCPALFTYRYDTNQTQYYGLVNLQTQPLKNTAEVQISFSVAAQLPSDYVGSIEAIGENRQLIDQIATGHGVSYRVNLPLQDPLPKLTKLSLNGRVLCNGPSEKADFVTEVNLRHFLQTGSNVQGLDKNKLNTLLANRNSAVDKQLSADVLTRLKEVGKRDMNHNVEQSAQSIGPNGNVTSYKLITEIVTYREYVSVP